MTTQTLPVTSLEHLVLRFSRMLSGGGFALFALWVLFFYETFVVIMTFAPINGGALGGFLEEFRIRCFQYEPKTGWMKWSSVAVMLGEPLPLVGIIFFIWRAPIRELWLTNRRAVFPIAAVALVMVGLLGAGLAGLGRAEPVQYLVDLARVGGGGWRHGGSRVRRNHDQEREAKRQGRGEPSRERKRAQPLRERRG